MSLEAAPVRRVTVSWSLLEQLLTGLVPSADWFDTPPDLRIIAVASHPDRPTCAEFVVRSERFARIPFVTVVGYPPERIAIGGPEVGLLFEHVPAWRPIAIRGEPTEDSSPPLARFVHAADELATEFAACPPGTVYKGRGVARLIAAHHAFTDWRKSRVDRDK